MSRKFHITIEIETPDDQQEVDAATWATAVLVTAFTKPNPEPKDRWGARIGPAVVPMPPSEHPFRPRVLGAVEVAQPAPRAQRH